MNVDESVALSGSAPYSTHAFPRTEAPPLGLSQAKMSIDQLFQNIMQQGEETTKSIARINHEQAEIKQMVSKTHSIEAMLCLSLSLSISLSLYLSISLSLSLLLSPFRALLLCLALAELILAKSPCLAVSDVSPFAPFASWRKCCKLEATKAGEG